MSIASTEAKKRWNKAHYSEIKASLKKELVEEFKIRCKKNEVSIASVLAALMSEYCGKTLKPANTKTHKKTSPYDTRPKRRKIAEIIANQLDEMLQSEMSYRENIPPNLQESERAENADNSIEKLGEALEAIRDAY